MTDHGRSDILLVQPKATLHAGFRAPLNLLHIASPLIDAGFNIRILDMHIEKLSTHELREYLENSLFVGISAFTGLQSSEAIKFAKLAKSINPDVVLVWGGYHPSLWHEIASGSHLVDYLITGAGEKTIVELARMLKGNEISRSKILSSDGNFEIPSPAWHLINMNKYIARTLLADRVANINTSYGCTHKCSFCAVSKVFAGKWKSKHASQVIDEVGYLVSKYGINGIEFSDNAPFVEKRRMLEIADGFLSKGFHISWMSMARADELNSLSQDEWKLIARSGFKRVFVGIESGDERILDRISKNETIADFFSFAENCALHEIIPDYSFTVGYPPEPLKDIEKSFELIRKLKKITPSGTVMFYRYTPYFLSRSLERQIEFPANWEGWAEKPWDSYSLNAANQSWVKNNHIRKLDDFETVMNCAFYREEKIFPQRCHMSQLLNLLVPIARFRWDKKLYSSPWELRALRRMLISLNTESPKERIAT